MRLPFLRKRCPDLDEKELLEAEEALIGYVRLWLEIWDGREITDDDMRMYEEDMARAGRRRDPEGRA